MNEEERMIGWLKVGGILLGLVSYFYLMFMGAVFISAWIGGVFQA